MLVVSRFFRLGGFSSLSFFCFSLFSVVATALRGLSHSSVAVIFFLLIKYMPRTFAIEKIVTSTDFGLYSVFSNLN